MAYNRGYLLGRVFALLVRLEAFDQHFQQLYPQASATPPQVFPAALARVIAAGQEEALFPLLQRLPPDTFEGPLNRREQGSFSLGYVHERMGEGFPTSDDMGDENGQELTERYEFRVDPQLKDWIKLSGGGTFLRSILRSERAKLFHGAPTERLDNEKQL